MLRIRVIGYLSIGELRTRRTLRCVRELNLLINFKTRLKSKPKTTKVGFDFET